MSNGGKSMLQELADALAICVRVNEAASTRRETESIRIAGGCVWEAANALERAIFILVGGQTREPDDK